MLTDLKNGVINRCQVCNVDKLDEILDLGFQPPCDSLLNSSDLNIEEIFYPLKLVRCHNCTLIQINYVVEPKVLFFPDYPYISGITKSLVTRLHSTAESVLKNFRFEANCLAVDIGSNDGTLLEGFKNKGFKVVGVEASNVAKIANQKGIKTYQEFFTSEVSKLIIQNHGKAKIVTATNVFAHVANLREFLDGVINLLEDDGIFISESHYLGNIYETLQFDSIYHEHLKFYSLNSLEFLLKQFGLHVVHVEKISNYGGSIRVFATKSQKIKLKQSVQDLRNEEAAKELNTLEQAIKFSKKSSQLKNQIRRFIVNKIEEGYKIFGIGCPGRASTFMNYVGLDKSLIPLILEQKNSLKLGKFLPGLHTPVVEEMEALNLNPDYLLLLSWHYADEIIENLRKKGIVTKIIVPLPTLRIVEI